MARRARPYVRRDARGDGAAMPLMRASRLLLDTNVWVDYFHGVGPGVAAIEEIVSRGLKGKVHLLYAPTSAKDVFYLISRRLRQTDARGSSSSASFTAAASACVRRMMEVADAAPQSYAECELACLLRSNFDDFEDNLIIAAAETDKADYVVTSDRLFLQALPEACITPDRAVALLDIAKLGAGAPAQRRRSLMIRGFYYRSTGL